MNINDVSSSTSTSNNDNNNNTTNNNNNGNNENNANNNNNNNNNNANGQAGLIRKWMPSKGRFEVRATSGVVNVRPGDQKQNKTLVSKKAQRTIH